MTWAIRSCALAAGAAALLSAQAAYAAPALNRSTSVDPLVSLSVLGTAQSRAAVCGATAGATFGSGHACALPGPAATATAAAAAAVAAQPNDTYVGGPQVGVLPLILGLVVLVGVAALIASGDDDGFGDLSPVPVSPA